MTENWQPQPSPWLRPGDGLPDGSQEPHEADPPAPESTAPMRLHVNGDVVSIGPPMVDPPKLTPATDPSALSGIGGMNPGAISIPQIAPPIDDTEYGGPAESQFGGPGQTWGGGAAGSQFGRAPEPPSSGLTGSQFGGPAGPQFGGSAEPTFGQAPEPQSNGFAAPQFGGTTEPQFGRAPEPQASGLSGSQFGGPEPQSNGFAGPQFGGSAEPSFGRAPEPQASGLSSAQFGGPAGPQFGVTTEPQFGRTPEPQASGLTGPQFGGPEPQSNGPAGPQFGGSAEPSFGRAPEPRASGLTSAQFGGPAGPQFGQAPEPQFGAAPQGQFVPPQPTARPAETPAPPPFMDASYGAGPYSQSPYSDAPEPVRPESIPIVVESRAAEARSITPTAIDTSPTATLPVTYADPLYSSQQLTPVPHPSYQQRPVPTPAPEPVPAPAVGGEDGHATMMVAVGTVSPRAPQPPATVEDAERVLGAAVDSLDASPDLYSIGTVTDGAVCLVPDEGKWAVFLADGGQRRFAGSFDDPMQAAVHFAGVLLLASAERGTIPKPGPVQTAQAALPSQIADTDADPLAQFLAGPPIAPIAGDPPTTLYTDHRLTVLTPGTEVDRFGDQLGNTVYAARTRYPHRSLPPDYIERDYRVYRVRDPLRALAGTAIPWFGQPGGGTAYLLPRSIEDLLLDGVLVEIQSATVAPG